MSIAAAAPKARKGLQARKRELYRAAVLDAAERVFGDEGYEEAKVQRIAAEAGLSLTTLYSVFESKWEIYRAVNRRRLTDIMALAEGILSEQRSSIEMLLAGMRMQLMFFIQHRDYLRMQLKEVTAWSTIELLRSPEQVEALGAGMRLFSGMFERVIEEGLFIDDDPELMARTAIASQQVRLAMWMERGCNEPPEAIVDSAVHHVLRCYCKHECLDAVWEAYVQMATEETS